MIKAAAEAGLDLKVAAQQDALEKDTRLVVGSIGGNTPGFNSILIQCSAKLREPSVLPGEPVDGDEPAAECPCSSLPARESSGSTTGSTRSGGI